MPITVEDVARRENVWLRAFFMGPTGSGKSRGALEIATRVFGGVLPVTLVNSERGRGKLYADRFRYTLIELDDDYSPESYVKAMDIAEQKNPGGVIVLDSVSHEWMGRNGILQKVDKKFGKWNEVRPLHNDFVDRILAVEGHVIACCRAKMKYEVTTEPRANGNGERQVISMLGIGPVQSDDLQYEFNVVARFEQATKEAEFSGHIDSLQGVVAQVVGESADEVAEKMTTWCSEGEPPAPPEAAPDDDIQELRGLLLAAGFTETVIDERFQIQRRQNRGKLSPQYVAEAAQKARERIANLAQQETSAAGAEAATSAEEGEQAELAAT